MDTERARNKFWRKVEKSENCWVWRGFRSEKGYGKFSCLGKTHRAHRFSWILAFGQIPLGMYVCHSCDNPSCVNPSHLWLGTNQQNIDDMVRKGRQTRLDRHPKAKLSTSNVEEIKKLRSSGATLKDLSARFHVCQSLISEICSGLKWRTHNPMPWSSEAPNTRL